MRLKRFVDLVLAATALAVGAVPGLAIAIAILLETGRPALFKQVRVGKNGREFELYKFRTMRSGTATVPTHEAEASEVTKVGSILRRLKVDELPQAFNVLRGEMSFVGPRPCLPSQHELVALRVNAEVLAVPPGITGYAQVRGVDMSDPIRLTELDRRYLADRSMALDMQILVATFLGRGFGDYVQDSTRAGK